MRRRFVTLDVFTDRRYAGNPLAVVRDAGGLETQAMQAIAGEFNLSETVFLLPPADAKNRAAVRIFTPASELPFAGHPTVGTAVLLGLDASGGSQDFAIEEKIGVVACAVAAKGEGGHATFVLPQLPTELGAMPTADALAAALSLAPADLHLPDFAPVAYSAGVPMAFVPLKGLDAARRCRPDAAALAAALGANGPRAVFVFCRETLASDAGYHARMFAPALGIREDPATGSAVAAFAGVLTRFAPFEGERTIVIEQGCEMGRPSRIALTLRIEAGRLTRAAIGGDAVIVAEGTIEA